MVIKGNRHFLWELPCTAIPNKIPLESHDKSLFHNRVKDNPEVSYPLRCILSLSSHLLEKYQTQSALLITIFATKFNMGWRGQKGLTHLTFPFKGKIVSEWKFKVKIRSNKRHFIINSFIYSVPSNAYDFSALFAYRLYSEETELLASTFYLLT